MLSSGEWANWGARRRTVWRTRHAIFASVEKALQYIEADVPARGAHGDETTVDVVPQGEPSAACEWLQFPANVLSAPVEFEQLRRIGSRHSSFRDHRRRRSHRSKLCCTNGAEVLVRIERSPLSQLLRIRERGPNLCGRVAEFASENQRPLLSIFANFSTSSSAWRVLITLAHVFFFPFIEGTCSILSKCCSKASTCFDQKRRNGTSHASSSISGSGLSR